MKLDRFPAHVRAQLEAKHKAALGAKGQRQKPRTPKVRGEMNRTEERFLREVVMPRLHAAGARLDPQMARYEGLALYVGAARIRYTPDWVLVLPSGQLCLVEVKARWKGGKVGWTANARTHWRAAAAEWGHVFRFEVWSWAADGGWRLEEEVGRE